MTGPLAAEGGRIAELLRTEPALIAHVAASMDSRTAGRCALRFAKAAGVIGQQEREKASQAELEEELRSAASQKEADLASLDNVEAAQMWKLMIRTAIPFVGFGFFDNCIMLTVGETLDCTLGVAFGFSTLAAAGMGQMVSDACGITLQGLIERFADRLGLPDPGLNVQQLATPFIKYFMVFARVIGIIFGCFLGMAPLIVMPQRTPRLVDQIAEKLSVDKRAEFQGMVKTQEFKRGEKLVQYSERSTKVFMIQEGMVDVIGRDVDGLPFSVCTIGPGHSFGVPELMRPSHVDLVAKDDKVVAQVIEKADFLRITSEEGGLEVFKEARNPAHQVYLRSQGNAVAGRQLMAVKGTGKTRMLASMDQEDRLKVLSFVDVHTKPHFDGRPGEGKVAFFANLTEEQKRHALQQWLEFRARDRYGKDRR